jgi:hypothetical protein
MGDPPPPLPGPGTDTPTRRRNEHLNPRLIAFWLTMPRATKLKKLSELCRIAGCSVPTLVTEAGLVPNHDCGNFHIKGLCEIRDCQRAHNTNPGITNENADKVAERLQRITGAM